MITLTDNAAQKIKELLAAEGKPAMAFRVKVVAGGCSGFSYELGFDDNVGAQDTVYEDKGVKILMDPESDKRVEGSQVDYVDSLMGAGFKVSNPNAKGSCGCGSSFEV